MHRGVLLASILWANGSNRANCVAVENGRMGNGTLIPTVSRLGSVAGFEGVPAYPLSWSFCVGQSALSHWRECVVAVGQHGLGRK